jgi:maltodextrin utilization protein YvdJ
MAAIDNSLVARSEAAVQHFAKRNWAAQEPGVIVVFAIVGCVIILVVGLFVQKRVC